MGLFIERFVLAVLAAIAVLAAFSNPMKWDVPARAALSLGVIALAFLLGFLREHGDRERTPKWHLAVWTPSCLILVALLFLAYHQFEGRNQNQVVTGLPVPPPTQPAQPPQFHVSGPARTSAPNSPANTGDGNTFNYGQSAPPGKTASKTATQEGK